MNDLRSLAVSLQGLLQCPVCFNPLDSSHSQCRNGHGVCSGCWSKLLRCPTCQEEFVLHKATLLNQILEVLPEICPYADKGCTQIKTDEHVMFCQFRHTKCRIPACTWEDCRKKLIYHVRQEHHEEVMTVSNGATPNNITIVKAQNTFHVKPLIYREEVFYLYIVVDGTLNRVMFRFDYLPISKPKSDYYFESTFTRNEITFTSTYKAYVCIDNAIGQIDYNDGSLNLPEFFLNSRLPNKQEYNVAYYLRIVDKSLAQRRLQVVSWQGLPE